MAEDRGGESVASGVREANWGDARARDLMRYVAADLSARAGFDICAVAVVRPDDHLELVTVAGALPGGEERIGTGALLSHTRRALVDGTDHGVFTFIRAEDMSPDTIAGVVDPATIPDIPVPEDAQTWHPLDMLVAQVRDDAGDARALVYLALPEGLRRPDARRIREITEAARLPLRSVLTVIEHESFTQHVRLLTVVRRLLHTGRRHEERDLLALASDGLRDAFCATVLEIQLFGEDWAGPLSHELGPDLRDALTDAAVRACATGRVVIIEPGEVWGDDSLVALEPALTDLLRSVDAGTLVLTPICAGREPLGLMLMARAPHERRWTDAESAAALDFGDDLGRCLLEARAAGRERELVEQLRWHESLRRSFATTIVHEFRTPLTVIRANAEMLETQGLPGEATAKLHAIDRGVSRLLGMVNDLATLAKVSDPTRELVRATVDLGAVLRDVNSTMRPVAARARVLLDEPDAARGVLVSGDPEELTRALTNVVDNAIKYSSPEGRVRTWLAAGPDGVVLGCRDDGLGISEADQQVLFTPFFRSTNPEALGRPGSGLGLDIVKSIVERHGGRITLDSALGSGTTFEMVLPGLDLTAPQGQSRLEEG